MVRDKDCNEKDWKSSKTKPLKGPQKAWRTVVQEHFKKWESQVICLNVCDLYKSQRSLHHLLIINRCIQAHTHTHTTEKLT